MNRGGTLNTFPQLAVLRGAVLWAGFSVVLMATFMSGCADATIGASRGSQACTPICAGKDCGDDGCGGVCGECTGADLCNALGTCYDPNTCTPNCAGKDCGDDGCGGSCGECSGAEFCNALGACYDPNACTPVCAGKDCGDDRCGGICGNCATGELCNGVGTCYQPNTCTPDCASKDCGDDGCGGSCGNCATGELCNGVGTCYQPNTCTPDCAGKDCGDDSCGGVCGNCAAGELCNGAGACYQPNACTPDCAGKDCGDDSCGGSCGSCAAGELCDGAGTCYQPTIACTPNCAGKACGNDGCGGSCGTCVSGTSPNTFYATRLSCVAPCAVTLDAQAAEGLWWDAGIGGTGGDPGPPYVKTSEFIWNFDDGGGTQDSEGFLAMALYETPGTYNPTVTVDGQLWRSRTITVTAPTRTLCVDTATGTDFSACPSAVGADHFTSTSSAVSSAVSGNQILFRRGKSFGNQTLEKAGVVFGAFDSGADPVFAIGGWRPGNNVVYKDLDVTSSSGTAGIDMENGDNITLLRMQFTNTAYAAILANPFTIGGYGPAFYVVNSNIVGKDYAAYATCEWCAWKGNFVDVTSTAEHTIRVPGANHLLVQENEIHGNRTKESLTVRGESGINPGSTWVLVQGNAFDTFADTQPQDSSANELLQNEIWERNLFDLLPPLGGYHQAANFTGRHLVIRNNIAIGDLVYGIFGAGGHSSPAQPLDVDFFNNTAYPDIGNSETFINVGGCPTCDVENNAAYMRGVSGAVCYVGGTKANNWCNTTGDASACVDPQDPAQSPSAGDCYPLNFVSTNPTSRDFMRIGAGSRGVDHGNNAVPVWDDYFNPVRPDGNIDVGAVER